MDLLLRLKIDEYSVPPGLSRNHPLRVNFDAAGTCIWRDGSGANPYGYGYTLDLSSGISTRLFPTEPNIRYNSHLNKFILIIIYDGGSASIWGASTQTSTLRQALPDFGSRHTNWTVGKTINNAGDRILVTRSSLEIHIFEDSISFLGTFPFGMGWGTFDNCVDMAIVIESSGANPLNRIRLLDTTNVQVLDTLELPEVIGVGGEYDYGPLPIFLTEDAATPSAVGQTALFIADTSTITDSPVLAIEIVGHPDVAENSTATYKIIGHLEDGNTRHVTLLSMLSVIPDTFINIDNTGLLRTGDIDEDTTVTLQAEYIQDAITLMSEKDVVIRVICPDGTAFQFDGVDDIGEIPHADSLNVTSGISIEVWANLTNAGTSSQRHACVVDSRDGSEGGYGLNVGTELIQFGVAGNWYLNFPSTIQTAQWHHVVGTYDRSMMAVYVDGIVMDSISKTRSIIPENGPLFIGQRYTTHDKVRGVMDEVAIWKQALLQEEIQANIHNRLDGTEPGLVASWNFDEGQGQIALDASGQDHDGYLGGTVQIESSDPVWVESDAPIGFCNPWILTRLNIEGAMRAKVEAQAVIQQALDKEVAAMEALRELSGDPDTSGLSRPEVLAAKQKVFVATTRQHHSQKDLEESIERLEEAFAILDGEGIPSNGQGSAHGPPDTLLQRADVNEDGVVDAFDMQGIAYYWFQDYQQGPWRMHDTHYDSFQGFCLTIT